jgi:anaerobic dimethyl sulfoxide reductase subunit C (anchor subunit)
MEIQWPLVFYTLLIGLGVGAFAFVAITEWLGKAERTRMPGAITALVAVALGGVASAFHLGHVERIFNVLSNLSSGIAQELILTGLTGLAILVYIITMRRGYSAQARKIVATIGLVLAVILAFAIGNLYVLPARPAWNTLLLPLLQLASAAVLGLFTMYIWTVVTKEETAVVMGVDKATLIALAIQALVVVAYVVYLAVAPFPNPTRSASRLLAGDLAPVFWGGLVVVGLLIPLGLTAWFFAAKKRVFPSLVVAVVGLVCVLAGGVATRALMYVLGSSIEKFS